jgi:hypothetical protein
MFKSVFSKQSIFVRSFGKFFVRKELNKNFLLNTFQNNILRSEKVFSKEREKVEEIHNKNDEIQVKKLIPQQLEILDSKNIITSLFFDNTKLLDSNPPYAKLLQNIIQTFSKHKLLENKHFLMTLQEIYLNYSHKSENVENSVFFKFLILVDQILENRQFSNYSANYNLAFPHLVNEFRDNFLPVFSKSGEMLLRFNFIYFLKVNKGEISEALFSLENCLTGEKKKDLQNLLNTKFKVYNYSSTDYSKLKTRLKEIEDSIKTPKSEVVSDVLFKYFEKDEKIKKINQSVDEKRTYEKAKYLLDYLRLNPQNTEISNLFPDSLTEFQKADLNNNNQKFNYLLSLKLSSLDKPVFQINIDNLHEIFNPTFSG